MSQQESKDTSWADWGLLISGLGGRVGRLGTHLIRWMCASRVQVCELVVAARAHAHWRVHATARHTRPLLAASA